jgi:XTP/dITP diphosphohydrolase
MVELIVGTSNPAKKQMIRSALAPLDIVVRGTDDIGISLEINEDGATAQENARKKSLAYAQALGRSVLSIDNALYLQGLTDAEQPGIHTRRIDGSGRATDEALLAHYSKQIERLGGRVHGHWEFAVCVATGRGQIFERTIVSPRTFVDKPSQQMIPGYPLESIQIEPESGMYISEMSPEEQDAFWQNIIGKQLCAFIREVQAQISSVL